MAITNIYNIDIQAAVRSNEKISITLDDAFFQALDQEEIDGGSLNVNMHATEDTRGIIHINTDIEGYVIVKCDRCLDPLKELIHTSDEIKVTYDENDTLSDEDINLMPNRGHTYNVGWNLYEIIVTSLPIERVHKKDECNPDMMQRFQQLEPNSDI